MKRRQLRPSLLHLFIGSQLHCLWESSFHISGVSGFVVSSPQQSAIHKLPQQLPHLSKSIQRKRSERVGWIAPLSSSPKAINVDVLRDDEDDYDEDDDEDEDLSYIAKAELWNQDDEADSAEDEAWMSDRERARAQKKTSAFGTLKQPTIDSPSVEILTTKNDSDNVDKRNQRGPSPYTDEEEDIINSMGGTAARVRKREPGFLGDSTLQEIAFDYSVPICYLADVLCMWGVPVPINVRDRLGDLVTGEQAFAILEAIYSLDVAALQDRYSNISLMNLCDTYGIPIKSAFDMAVKEGWSLPFGVQTCLRVEQEEELLRVLGNDLGVE